jgi:uncharacterized HAD superfamily protein
MASTLRIGVDVDDVLAESLPGYLEAFRRYFGHEVKVEEAMWEISHRYPDIPAAAWSGFYAELEATDFLATRPVYPDAVAGIRSLAARGHRLVVVTGRLTMHRQHTRRLLQGAGIAELFEDVVHRDGEAARDYKPRIVREKRLQLLIEDELHVAMAAAQVPVPVLLVNRPWNQGDLPQNVTRVGSWDQVLCLVEAAAHAAAPDSDPAECVPGRPA